MRWAMVFVVADVWLSATPARSEIEIGWGAGASLVEARTPFAESGMAPGGSLDLGIPLTDQSRVRIRYEAYAFSSELHHDLWLFAELRPWRLVGFMGGAGLSAQAFFERPGSALGLGAFAEQPIGGAWQLRWEALGVAELASDLGITRLRAGVAVVYRW